MRHFPRLLRLDRISEGSCDPTLHMIVGPGVCLTAYSLVQLLSISVLCGTVRPHHQCCLLYSLNLDRLGEFLFV